jgi:D-arabinose 1-dehydrogenase-like Zn-dependent alcohol dehydrogenase
MSDPRELLDETTLRRALRLDFDERPPLFDATAAIASARSRSRQAVGTALVALGLTAVGAVAVWSAVAVFLPTVVVSVFDGLLAALALLAVPASGIAEIVQQPVVPLSLLVALAIATTYELRERMIYASAS